mmetsp:Transcript_47213/g.109205  ORF Transcript_47213/g.109205 Transcript_47213/m.109205 type:complete len:281 (-) Transcript_47213:32-874(-)
MESGSVEGCGHSSALDSSGTLASVEKVPGGPCAGTGEEEDFSSSESAPSVEKGPGGDEDVSGDYRWKLLDGTESILRLRAGGLWWHAVHRFTKERCRIVDDNAQERRNAKPTLETKIWREYKGDFGLKREQSGFEELVGEYREVEVWEIAECLGSWTTVRQTVDEGAPASDAVVLLTCENWSWKASHPTAPLALRPTEDCRRELNEMVDASQLALCYSVSRDPASGGRRLDLNMQYDGTNREGSVPSQAVPRHIRMRSLQAAFQTLGFARSYRAGADCNS